MKRLLVFAFILIVCPVIGQNAPKIASQAAISDLNETVRLIESVHYNPYLYIDSARFHAKKIELLRHLESRDSVSLYEFIIDSKNLLAKLGDGHTTISVLFPEMMDGQFFPTTVSGDFDNQVIIQDSDAYPLTITRINDQNAFNLFEESMTLYGGNENFRRAMSETILFPIYLYLRGIIPPFEIIDAEGNASVIQEGVGIYTLAEQQGSTDDYTFSILENNVGYLAYNKCNNADAFKKFLKATFAQIESEGIDKLIIDIRENTGGTSSLNDMLIPYFTKKEYRQSSSRYWRISDEFKAKITEPIYTEFWGEGFVEQYIQAPTNSILKEDEYRLTEPEKPRHYFEGKSCMLIGPKTFSSANFLADAVSVYGLTTLIGKDTGEYTNDFGEQISFTLPATGLTLQVAIAFDLGADGNSEKLEAVHPNIETEEDALSFALNWIQKAP